jgi:LacI family transcriptional regulator
MQRVPRVLLFIDISRGFGRGMLSGITRYAALHGPWTFYHNPPGYLKPNARFRPKQLAAWKPDGIIYSMAQFGDFSSLGVPLIAYEHNTYTGPIPCIRSNDTEVGRLAARHLLDQGHRQFGFCGYNGFTWSTERCEAFCGAIEEAGGRVEIYRSTGRRYTPEAKEEARIREWLKALPKPIGVLCANDDRAESVLQACAALEYGVPEDVSVVGVDDDEYVCELQNPPLSSIRLATEQAGYQTAALLHRMMHGEEIMSGQRITAQATGVTPRQSTDMLMVRHADVRKALRFIRENVNRAIRVTDVVRATGLSHRGLNDRFNAELGCSIVEQLTRARTAFICRLLADTDMQIQEIAKAVGYEDDRHFSRYVKRATGLTPQAYRRKILLP